MVETTLNASEARKKFYQLLKNINKNHREIQIISEVTVNNEVLISLEYWQSIKETLLLEETEVLDKVRRSEKDDSGFTNIDEIDLYKI